MIEKFTKQDFEDYLQSHSPFEALGLIDGEYAYLLPLDNQVSITIRSSIKSNGLSADVGKDSIRCWLTNGDKPLGSKVSTKWTTRIPGWQDRLNENIKQLVLWRTLAGDCKECGLPKGIFKVKKEGGNKGRPFATCKNKSHKSFVWLDEPIKINDIYFGEESNGNTGKEKNSKQENSLAHFGSESENNADMPTGNNTDGTTEVSANEQTRTGESLPELLTDTKKPNESQERAIEADIDVNLIVSAGPGSGKTLVIEYRYAYLVNNGINSQNILVCTFSKPMADEMGHRIKRSCPVANLEQISTIHAFCYRLLCKWYPDSRYYKWQVPKDWQVKSTLEDIIGNIWKESEKPNAKEVFDYICTSKGLGLTTDDSYEYFITILGQLRGTWLYNIRAKFDAWLNRNRSLTFADMLFLVEQRLKNDSDFRTMLQQRFSHVVIDESQDTNYQAMRILITLSLEPGQNTIYESEVK